MRGKSGHSLDHADANGEEQPAREKGDHAGDNSNQCAIMKLHGFRSVRVGGDEEEVILSVRPKTGGGYLGDWDSPNIRLGDEDLSSPYPTETPFPRSFGESTHHFVFGSSSNIPILTASGP